MGVWGQSSFARSFLFRPPILVGSRASLAHPLPNETVPGMKIIVRKLQGASRAILVLLICC